MMIQLQGVFSSPGCLPAALFRNVWRRRYLTSVPDEQLASETRFHHRLRLDTYSHYPIHTQAIRALRQPSA